MPTIESSIIVPAPPERVWDVVSDPAQAPEWMPDVRERHPLQAGPLAQGSRWKESGVLRSKSYQIEYEVTLWQPPAQLRYKQASSGKRQYMWEESIRIEGTDAGSRVTASLQYELPGGLATKLYERLVFRRDFQGTLDNRLEALRELLEETGEG